MLDELDAWNIICKEEVSPLEIDVEVDDVMQE